MSGIAAIYCTDGRPVARERLRRMSRRLAHRGPDSGDHWIDGSIGLTYRALRTTPESLTECQPYLDPDGGLALVMDGRLDARADLIAAVRDRAVDTRTSDVALVTAAYRKWGIEAFAHLIGDFAIVVWDARRRHVVVARDPLGIRPVYYRCTDGEFLCASELAVIARELQSIRPNEGMVAECLASAVTSREDTLIAGIQRLPAGHALVATSTGVRTFAYWNPSNVQPLRYRHADDYAEHLQELVTIAVQSRLRSSGAVGLMVSGGVDSSSVAGAAHFLTRNGFSSPNLEMFSLASGDACDETEYARHVGVRLGLRSHLVPVRSIPSVDEFRAESVRSFELPTYPSATIGDSLREEVRQRGIRVLLTGIGGDEWLDGTVWRYADLFRSFRWVALGREIAADLRTDYVPNGRVATKATLWPLLSPDFRRRIRQARRRWRQHAWIDAEFARRTRLADRVEAHDHGIAFRSNELSDLWHEGVSGWAAHNLEMLDRTGARFGIEHRHPFHDRRIVEFAFALPMEERRWRGVSKRVLRRGMANVLPNAVVTRSTNPTFSHIVACSLEACEADMASESSAIVKRGWIRGDRVLDAYRDMRARFERGEGYAADAGALWMVYGVEQWARTIFNEEHHAATRNAWEEDGEETVCEAASDRIRQRCEADDERRHDAERIGRPEQEETVSIGQCGTDVPRSR